MRILLTNDDGVNSPGILLLAKALRDAGHRVFVIAPDADRSGISHAVTFFNNPCKIKQIEADTWSCSGTPVDCVVLTMLGGFSQLCLTEDRKNVPDLILSGINRGANLGTDIVYSGTAAAARQGSLYGIPSVALSLVENGGNWHWEPVISFTVEKLEEMCSYWKAGAFVNVNFPNTKTGPCGIVKSSPCQRVYNDKIEVYTAPGGEMYCFVKVGKSSCSEENADGTDWDEVRKNNASLSVIFSQPIIT